jgi:hypothetical protein
MQVFEITGNVTGISRQGVNFLQPKDSYQNLFNGYIYRQVVQSRQGFSRFSTGALDDGLRVMGIFNNYRRNGSIQCLAVTLNHLYVYDEATDTFIEVPTGGSLGIGHTFGIASNDEYVSGTTYPFADGSDRFVFTSKGMTHVYQYDPNSGAYGTVTDYTNAADNLNYVAPASGALTKAKYVIYFGERLNFFYPEIGAQPYPQGHLFSGIRTASGNGDNYNVSGSGLIILDTQEYINGASILGNVIALNLSRSNWTVEKTRDAFNPYLPRKVPSVVGTDADFSFVSWSDIVRSIGKTGIISTDGRQSQRVDDKIPFFTRDDIDQPNFGLIYGGFDRANAQFLFSYLSSEDDFGLDSQDRCLVNNYEEQSWSIYDWRFTCFCEIQNGQNIVWDAVSDVDHPERPEWAEWDTTEDIWDKIGLGESVTKTIAGDNYGNIWQLNVDYDDYFVSINGITQANQAVITITDPIPFVVGDQVAISGVVGMTEINNYDPENDIETSPPYNVVAVNGGLNQITIDVDSSLFGAYVSGGTLSKTINFTAETIPFNPWRAEGLKCYCHFVELLINTNGGEVLFSVLADEDETPFIQNVVLSPTNTQARREWISVSVDQESNFFTFIMNQNSPGQQIQITSMRIHCAKGGLTSY